MLENLIKFRDVSKVFFVLTEAGGESRFIGGCVRDTILGVTSNDVDIATTLRPDLVEHAFKSQNIKTIDIGKDHGTIVVVINSYSYQITTLRKDVETDGRRAIVEYSDDWQEDALRRDFTINAMSYCPYKKEIYDYFGGVGDLQDGVIKFVGIPEQRVQEDYLRILRFFRFYTYYGRKDQIDKRALAACIKYAPKIKTISAERKSYEFQKILAHEKCSDTIDMMLKSGILSILFEHEINEKVVGNLETLHELSRELKYTHSFLLKLFVILSASKMTIDAVDNVFHLSNKDKKYFKHLGKIDKIGIAGVKKNLYELIYDQECLLEGLLYLFLRENIVDLSLFDEVQKYSKQKKYFPVTGKDIMSNFHIKEGKDVGKMLKRGKTFWCKSKYSASKDAIVFYLNHKN